MAVIQCPDCDGKVSTNADVCPHCGNPEFKATPEMDKKEPWGMRTKSDQAVTVGCMVILILGGIWCFVGSFFSGSEDTKTKSAPVKVAAPEYSAEAAVECQLAVRKKLKSPSTADFPYAVASQTQKEPNLYFLFSYVDSQNSFGATMRTEFGCKADCTDGNCKVIGVEFE